MIPVEMEGVLELAPRWLPTLLALLEGGPGVGHWGFGLSTCTC